ncbi:MAG: TolC family protein [Stenotrophobium sp.]
MLRAFAFSILLVTGNAVAADCSTAPLSSTGAPDAQANTTCAGHDGTTWSLTDLIDALKRDNPQLQQARDEYLAAKLQTPQAQAIPGPQFSLAEQANSGGPFDFNSDSGFYAYYTLTQPLLWPGKLQLAGEIAKALAEVVGSQRDSLELQLVSQLKLDFYQLVALQDQLRFLDEDLQRLEQVKAVARVRYANNAAAYVDFLNAQVSASSVENDRYTLQKQIQTATEQINSLIGRSTQAPLQIDDPHSLPKMPTLPLPQLIDLAEKTNPVISGGQSQIEAAGNSVSLAKKAYYPDFGLVIGSYSNPPVGVRSMRMYTVGVNLNLPTWFFEKERAGVDQAQAQLDAARASQLSTRQQVELNVANAYHGLETAIKQIGFSRERLLPQAQMAYRLALTAYSDDGGTAFSDLLTAQSNLRDTQLALLQAQNAAVQAYISLAAAIGRDPD